MNQNMKFIFGLIVGFFICYFLTKNDNHSEKKPQAKSQTEETVVSEPIKQTSTRYKANKMDLPQEESIVVPQPPQTKLQATMKMVDSIPAEPTKKRMKIQFSLHDIMTMESEWVHLQNQIQVSKEERGWRVKMLAPNSVFATTGLTEGNLITYDSIRALGNDENLNLPRRIATILNHVSTQ